MQVGTSRSTKFILAVICALLATPSPSVAWSFSSIFSGGDDSESGSGNSAVDKSDGTDVAMQQPLLKATDWFLTEEEITASRGGSPRSDLATYSVGNAVTTFTVTKEFFDAVYDDLTTTKEDDRVMLAAWNTDLVPFQPDVDPTGAKSNFDIVFGNVVKRGGDVKILGWANKFMFFQDVKVRNKINKLPRSGINDGNALFIFDDRLPYGLSSQHQKTLVIAAGNSTNKKDQPVAYVGGIDLSNDRWDTIHHNVSAIRKESGVQFRQNGWVDSSVRIHGPAAKDVANNFLARWNSPHLPTQGLGDDMVDFENPQYSYLPPLDYVSSNTTSKLGSQNVQIVRTFSCKYKHWEFAPNGENSLFHARIKAIKNAKNFIYIEDQYFILVPELLDALLEVLPGLQRLIVVVEPPELLTKSGGYEKYMYQNVQPLKEKFPNKVKLYSMKPDLDIYVHSKLVVVDDVYLTTGSANWNRRSMTSDPELSANIVDSSLVKTPDGIKVGKVVRDFRVRKFVEMTGRSYEKIDSMKFLDAAELFDTAAAEATSLIQKFDIDEELYYKLFSNSVHEKIDRDDRYFFDYRSPSGAAAVTRSAQVTPSDPRRQQLDKRNIRIPPELRLSTLSLHLYEPLRHSQYSRHHHVDVPAATQGLFNTNVHVSEDMRRQYMEFAEGSIRKVFAQSDCHKNSWIPMRETKGVAIYRTSTRCAAQGDLIIISARRQAARGLPSRWQSSAAASTSSCEKSCFAVIAAVAIIVADDSRHPFRVTHLNVLRRLLDREGLFFVLVLDLWEDLDLSLEWLPRRELLFVLYWASDDKSTSFTSSADAVEEVDSISTYQRKKERSQI